MTNEWMQLTVAERDRRAWEAIVGWPAAAGFDPVEDGIDVAVLTRALLWAPVGRAVRAMLGDADPQRTVVPDAGDAAQRAARAPSLRARALSLRMRLRRARGRPLLWCPLPFSRHARILEPLLQSAGAMQIGIPWRFERDWPGAVPWCGNEAAEADAPAARAADVCRAIVAGLGQQGVELTAADARALGPAIAAQLGRLRAADRTLSKLRPAAVLVWADNHAPGIELVLAARRREVPTVMLQHGLDCERYVHDDAEASHVAVWGAERARRYREKSRRAPRALTVIGNPAYDDRRPPSRLSAAGSGWVWVTRPHHSDKCFAPSRKPGEGEAILRVLLRWLARDATRELVIKPHPFDPLDGYERLVRDAALSDRCRIERGPLFDLLRDRHGVISEDSTAGMDAMMAGKPLVHAHFAASAPVMPFTVYAAALPGFGEEQLIDSLNRLEGWDDRLWRTMYEGQRQFLAEYAGPLDGQAAERFRAFVHDVAAGG